MITLVLICQRKNLKANHNEKYVNKYYYLIGFNMSKKKSESKSQHYSLRCLMYSIGFNMSKKKSESKSQLLGHHLDIDMYWF